MESLKVGGPVRKPRRTSEIRLWRQMHAILRSTCLERFELGV